MCVGCTRASPESRKYCPHGARSCCAPFAPCLAIQRLFVDLHRVLLVHQAFFGRLRISSTQITVDGGSCSSAVLPDPGIVSRATSANRSGVFSGVRFRRPPRLRRRARLRPNRAGLPVHINLIGSSRDNSTTCGARRAGGCSKEGARIAIGSYAAPVVRRDQQSIGYAHTPVRTFAVLLQLKAQVVDKGIFGSPSSSDLAGRGSGPGADIGQLSDAELEAQAQALAVVCRGTTALYPGPLRFYPRPNCGDAASWAGADRRVTSGIRERTTAASAHR